LFAIFGCQIICQVTSRAAGEIYFIVYFETVAIAGGWVLITTGLLGASQLSTA